MKKKIFFSYCTSDKKKKDVLKNKIKKTTGLEAIVVEDYSKNNKNIIDKVKDDIKRADYFVPIFTEKSYQKSQWVNQELGYAEAILGRKKIYVLVQKDIMKELVGFYNIGMDLSYNFDAKKNEQKNFLQSVNKLIAAIVKKEKKTKPFKPVSKKNNEKTDKVIDLPITDSLKIYFQVKKSNLSQNFICYYEVETDLGETLWVGFTDKKENIGSPHKTRNEFTNHIGQGNALMYKFTDDIKKTFLERWPDKGSPKLLKKIRFRGDKNIHLPILYSYKINQ